MPQDLGEHAFVCENCLFHHKCKNLCTMSPRHISVDEARRRIERARIQLHTAIQNREIGKEEQEYLEGVLVRGEESCQKACNDLKSKTHIG